MLRCIFEFVISNAISCASHYNDICYFLSGVDGQSAPENDVIQSEMGNEKRAEDPIPIGTFL